MPLVAGKPKLAFFCKWARQDCASSLKDGHNLRAHSVAAHIKTSTNSKSKCKRCKNALNLHGQSNRKKEKSKVTNTKWSFCGGLLVSGLFERFTSRQPTFGTWRWIGVLQSRAVVSHLKTVPKLLEVSFLHLHSRCLIATYTNMHYSNESTNTSGFLRELITVPRHLWP